MPPYDADTIFAISFFAAYAADFDSRRCDAMPLRATCSEERAAYARGVRRARSMRSERQ